MARIRNLYPYIILFGCFYDRGYLKVEEEARFAWNEILNRKLVVMTLRNITKYHNLTLSEFVE